MINKYLTPLEQEIMNYLSPDSVLTFSMLKELNSQERITSAQNLRQLLSSLEAKKKLLRIKKGLYYVVRDGYDEFLVGQYLFDGYLGFSTALWLYGWKTEEPHVCYVVVRKGKNEKEIGRMIYKTVSLGRLAIGDCYIKRYRVSTKAKTFFDCFCKPKYAGGYDQIVYSLGRSDLSGEDWAEFTQFLKMYGSSSVKQRVGYVFSSAGDKSVKIPSEVIKEVKRMVNKPVVTVLDPSLSRTGKFDKKWKIYDNVFRR
jgi:predicted transcriptional regulator of viral defense system